MSSAAAGRTAWVHHTPDRTTLTVDDTDRNPLSNRWKTRQTDLTRTPRNHNASQHYSTIELQAPREYTLSLRACRAVVRRPGAGQQRWSRRRSDNISAAPRRPATAAPLFINVYVCTCSSRKVRLLTVSRHVERRAGMRAWRTARRGVAGVLNTASGRWPPLHRGRPRRARITLSIPFKINAQCFV
ncbi:unnamed protein product [Spodoptera exigua]|nr:unnamed protein product [Spodoptera exigua]